MQPIARLQSLNMKLEPHQRKDRRSATRVNTKYVQPSYEAVGVEIRSQIPLPELDQATRESSVNGCIQIKVGKVHEQPFKNACRKPWFNLIAKNHCIIEIPNVARFSIIDGETITVDRRVEARAENASKPKDVRTYLLGSVLAAALYQRGAFVLHASAIQAPTGIWAFAGPSGAGKSTLVAWIAKHLGLAVYTDDIGCILPDVSPTVLYPGPPRLKLWKDTLKSLGIAHEGLIRDSSRADKYHISTRTPPSAGNSDLRGLIYLLPPCSDSSGCRLDRLSGVRSYQTIMASRYRPEVSHQVCDSAQMHKAGGMISQSIDVYELTRPWSLEVIKSQIDTLHPLFFGSQANA